MIEVHRFLPMTLSLRSLHRALLVLLVSLIMSQTVGVLHRVAHAKQSVGVLAHATAPAGREDGSLLAAMLGEHSSSAECQLFDQACPDFLHVPTWALPAATALPIWGAAALQERFALFVRFYAARGPPATLF